MLDAVTAALLGTSLGVVGTLGAAWVNPFTTAKKTQEAKLLEMRRDAYVQGIQIVQQAPGVVGPEALRAISRQMMGPVAQMRLLASEDVGDLYAAISKPLLGMASALEHGEDHQPHVKDYIEALDAFITAARAHIGVDEIER